MDIFKECDIRGLYCTELDENTAVLIGKAVGTLLEGGKVVIGGDARLSTESLRTRLIEGLLCCGCTVVDIGVVPTPVLYFSEALEEADGGVMVTASHNPAEYNGFKLSLRTRPVESEDIQKIKKLVSDETFLSGNGQCTTINIEKAYTDHIRNLISAHSPLKVVIDCGNGAASEIAPSVFQELGHEVVRLYCSFDGSFPNRNPNPSEEKHLDDLKKKVLSENADLGIAYDGDGDRVTFVDNSGRYCPGEKSFVILLEHYLDENVSTVVYDGKSSAIVRRAIEKLGSAAVMEKSGHAFIKKTFHDTNSIIAGEASGHFFFREFGFDDGIFASLKMTEIVSRSGRTMSELIDDIENTVITPDIRIGMKSERIDKLLEDLSEFGRDYEISFLDGVRIEFPAGWILVRKSITEPCITIRLEADTPEEAFDISSLVFYGPNEDIRRIISENLKELK